MISLSIVGRVVDRPFRPGNSNRVVLKIDADDERGRTQHLELDAFAENGDWVMKNVMVGEMLALTARLENRIYHDAGEEVEELRIVAVRFEPTRRRPDRPDRDRSDRDRPDRPDRPDRMGGGARDRGRPDTRVSEPVDVTEHGVTHG